MIISTDQIVPKDTERLTFRFLTLHDEEEWKKFTLSEDAMKFFTFPKEESQSKIWIERQINRYMNNKGGLMAVCLKDKGLFIGQCGLLVQDLEGQEVLEVGYSFLPEFWGKGYASEAASVFYELGKSLNVADHILSVIHKDNLASQKVASNNGLSIWKETTWKEMPVQVWRTEQ